MGIAADAIRHLWMPGIHTISGRPSGGFSDWIKSKEYQIYSAVAPDRFTLAAADLRPLRMAFAADICRLGGAAFETALVTDDEPRTPKACAWLLIRSYYAAYYAGNALCRILGTSISQLESEHASAVYEVADLYGQTPLRGIQNGLFECIFDRVNNSVDCIRKTGGGGAHEMFWACFLSFIRRVSDGILNNGTSSDQRVAAKLIDLSTNMCLEGRNGGNWLSLVRNQVTYRHAEGAWFPYRSGIRRDKLLRLFESWKHDAMKTELVSFSAASIERYVATCAFVLSLCREVFEDLANRSPNNQSFLKNGPHAYLNHMGANTI